MPALKKTSPAGSEGNTHYHIVYVDYETGEAYLSPGSSSTPQSLMTHQITFIPEIPAQTDANGNITVQSVPSQFRIEPAEDGHTHEIVEYEPMDLFPAEEESTIRSDFIRQFKNSLFYEEKSISNGRESWDFYFGKQWKNKHKRKLEGQDRAALTINDTARFIDTLSGYQRQQRTDIHYLPVEGGDQRVADALNTVTKVILNNCFFPREESKVFMDQIVPGRGLWNLYVSTDKDIRGDIIVERFPWDQAVIGPHEKEDGSDAEAIFKHKLYSLSQLKRLFPDKAEDLQRDYLIYSQFQETVLHLDKREDAYEDATDKFEQTYVPSYIGDEKMVDPIRKEFRLIERHLKVYIPTTVLFYDERNFYFTALGWKTEDINLAKKMNFLKGIDTSVTKFRITKLCGNTILSDENPADLAVDDYFLIPVYGKKHGNEFRGKVEDIKDAQRNVNHRYSQSIDITNKMVAYGWFYDNSTFPSPAEKRKFLKNSSKPGFTQEVANINNRPVQQEGTKFPNEIVQLLTLSSSKVAELMNIEVTPGGANESGDALLQKTKLRLTGNELFFDNLSFAKQKIGRLLVALIRRYYSPARILRILQDQHTREPVSLAGQNLAQYTEDQILELLQDIDVSKYDVVVGESGQSPTARMTTYLLLKDMQQGGQPVPPELLVETADIPEDSRNRILQGLQASQDAQAAQAKDAGQTEIDKTLIAHGVIPPRVQAELDAQKAALGQQGPAGVPPQPGQQIFGNDRSIPPTQ